MIITKDSKLASRESVFPCLKTLLNELIDNPKKQNGGITLKDLVHRKQREAFLPIAYDFASISPADQFVTG